MRHGHSGARRAKKTDPRSVLLCVAFAACRASAPPPTTEAEPRAPARVTLTPEALSNAGVVVERAGAITAGPSLEVAATVEADPSRMARVGARVSGRVTAVRVALGDAVRAGDALIEVDTVELHQVTNEYVTAVARARQARDVLERARVTHGVEMTSTEALRRAEADDAVARATLHEAEEHLHFLGLRDQDIARLRTTTSHGETRSVVRSPVSGRVASIGVTVGQVVGAEQEVARVGSTDAVWLRLHLFAGDVARVRPGAAVQARSLDAEGARLGRGEVVAVSDVMDPASHTVDARARFAPTGPVVTGAPVRVSVALPTGGARWLPSEAVQPREGRAVVFVRVGERAFEPRAVTVGDAVGGAVPVREGLREGDAVVVRGAFALRSELEREGLEEDD